MWRINERRKLFPEVDVHAGFARGRADGFYGPHQVLEDKLRLIRGQNVVGPTGSIVDEFIVRRGIVRVMFICG